MPAVDYVTYTPPREYAMEAPGGLSAPYTSSVEELTWRLVALENENARLASKNKAFLCEMQSVGERIGRTTLEADVAHLQSQVALLERHNAELSSRLASSEAAHQSELAVIQARHGSEVADWRAEQERLEAQKQAELLVLQMEKQTLATQAEVPSEQLKSAQARVEVLTAENAELARKIALRERELADQTYAEAMARDQLLRRVQLLEKHVQQRTGELQAATRRQLTAETEMKAVRAWWAGRSSGPWCTTKDPEPWKKNMLPVPPVPPAPQLTSDAGAPSRSAPVVATTAAPAPVHAGGVRRVANTRTPSPPAAFSTTPPPRAELPPLGPAITVTLPSPGGPASGDRKSVG
eukprot:RCo006005